MRKGLQHSVKWENFKAVHSLGYMLLNALSHLTLTKIWDGCSFLLLFIETETKMEKLSNLPRITQLENEDLKPNLFESRAWHLTTSLWFLPPCWLFESSLPSLLSLFSQFLYVCLFSLSPLSFLSLFKEIITTPYPLLWEGNIRLCSILYCYPCEHLKNPCYWGPSSMLGCFHLCQG